MIQETLDIPADESPFTRFQAHTGAVADLVRKKRVRFLCGAGMSRQSGYPLGSELARKMVGAIVDVEVATNLDPSIVSRYPLEAIASAYLADRDHPQLRDLLRGEFARAVAEPHDGHVALEYLASQGYIDRVYTTNFDTLIEDGFGERAETVTDHDPDALVRALSAGKIPVIHLHGNLDWKCLISEQDTYLLDTPLARVMAADMVTRHFVWIGYSMGDVDLRSLYLATRDLLKRGDDLVKTSYFVHPVVGRSAAAEARLAELVWQARGGRFIPATASEFLADVVRRVRRSRGEDMVTALITRRGLDPTLQAHRDEVWSQARTVQKGHRFDDEIEGLEFLAQRAQVDVGS